MDRDYLRVGYLADLMRRTATDEGPVTSRYGDQPRGEGRP
jgi:hypothetical protein